MNKVLFKNPYVLIAASVALVVLGIRKMIKAQNRIKNISKDVTKELDKNSMSYVKQKVQVNNLLKPVNNLMLSTEKRTAALKKLQQIHPDYFQDLTIEEGKVLDVKDAYDKLITSLKNTARQKAISTMLEDLQGRKLNLEIEMGEAFQGQSIDEIKDFADKGAKEGSDSFFKRLKNNLKEGLNDLGVADFTEEWQKAERAVDEYLAVQREINKLMKKVDPSQIEEHSR